MRTTGTLDTEMTHRQLDSWAYQLTSLLIEGNNIIVFFFLFGVLGWIEVP